jgi:hypothetical protein
MKLEANHTIFTLTHSLATEKSISDKIQSLQLTIWYYFVCGCLLPTNSRHSLKTKGEQNGAGLAGFTEISVSGTKVTHLLLFGCYCLSSFLGSTW